ncbi:hypothetical protein [Lujinxingia vulgaris]|nr:hypothetical protein [Lujinxingia vulgaris]
MAKRWIGMGALLMLLMPALASAQEAPGVEAEVEVEAEAEAEVASEEGNEANATGRAFVGDTALLSEVGRWEVGLFGPLRYGLSEKMELAVHPLLFFVAPNAQLKVSHGTRGGWHLASKHQLTYPTLLFRLMAREGIGGILPADRAVPHILSLQSELLVTREVGAHKVSLGLGVQVAPRVGESQLVSIDLPFVYPRTAAMFGWATGIMSVHMQGPIAGKLGYEADVRAFTYPGVDGAFAVEQGAALRLTTSPGFMAQLGYRLSYAGYPFGTMFNIAPTLELAWGF